MLSRALRSYASRIATFAKLLWSLAASRFLGLNKAPRLLRDWKSYPSIEKWYQDLWLPYHHFFRAKGYTLWKKGGRDALVPPTNDPRTPDGFSYENAYSAAHPSGPNLIRTIHCPARTVDNRDVLIALLSDGVNGVNAIDALKHVATGAAAAIDRNHALPLLQQLHCGNLVFGVFPLVGNVFTGPWFVFEALDAMSQILEGVAFLHDHLTAHRDLFCENFLISRRNGLSDPKLFGAPKDFQLPRYYIIDFEWAVRFDSSSDPATRTVIGPPFPWDSYRRAGAPEMRSSEPHCPFKADVWQVGTTFLERFQQLDQVMPEVTVLLNSMIADNPNDRPTARAAVEHLNALRFAIPHSALQQIIDEPECEFTDSDRE